MDDPVVTRALALLRQAIDAAHDLTPKEYREIQAIEFIALKMMWQSVSRCDAIHHLLTEGFLDDSIILLRSLMWDAQRLIYMDQNPKDRFALLFEMGYEKIRNMEGLASGAEVIGQDAEIIRDAVTKQRREIEQARAARGVVKRKKFPKEGVGIAKSIGRLTDVLGHQMYSASTHSAALSMFTNISTTEDGKVNFSSRNKNPGYVRGVAWSAAENLFEGAIATARAQEWGSLAKLRESYAEIGQKFAQLGNQKYQHA